jgi:hypothetical protein
LVSLNRTHLGHGRRNGTGRGPSGPLYAYDSAVLIDGFMPVFDVSERHHVLVEAPAEEAFRAVRRVDLALSAPIRALFAVRGIPALLRRRPRGEKRSMTLDDLIRAGFVLLAEEPPREIVLGVVGTFWRPTGGVRRIEASDFADFSEPGRAKAAWNFRVESVTDGGSVVFTETRIRCADEPTRKKFLLYWAAIGPFSGLIRRRALNLIRADAERASG